MRVADESAVLLPLRVATSRIFAVQLAKQVWNRESESPNLSSRTSAVRSIPHPTEYAG